MRALARPLIMLILLGVAVAAARAQPATANTSGFRWDALHQLVGTIAPDPDGGGPLGFPATRYSYDVDGKLIAIEQGVLAAWQSEGIAPSAWSGFSALATTRYAYDAVGDETEQRLTTAQGGTAPQAVTQTSYDIDDRPTCTAVRMSLSAIPAAGSDACARHTPDPNFGADRITQTIYDPAGEVLQTRRGVGTPLDQAEVTFHYTSNGRRDQIVDAAGNRSSQVYDGFDRLSLLRFPSPAGPTGFDGSSWASALGSAGAANGNDYEQYTYDANDNRVTLRKRGGETLAFGYDSLDRVTTKRVPAVGQAAGYTVNTGYDLLGHRLTALFDGSGLGVTDSYDAAGRLDERSDNSSGTTRTIGYRYDADGNRTRLTWPGNGFVTTTYDPLDRATGYLEGGTTPIVTIAFDDLGRRTAITRGGGVASTGYVYDPALRLKTLSHDLAGGSADVAIGLLYNPAGQIVSRSLSADDYAYAEQPSASRSYASNGLNQYAGIASASSGTAAPSYDGDANLSADGRGTSYAYDGENRLIAASGLHNLALAYDPLGRLLRSGTGAAASQFLFDGDTPIAEYDAGGTLVRRYLPGPSPDETLVWYEGAALSAATRRYLIADQEGSTIAITDGAGNRIATDSYDEWGTPNAAGAGRYRYTGQLLLPELGLYSYKARAYSPALGRFLQTDPVGYADQYNLYAYVGNDPGNRTDPSGNGAAAALVPEAIELCAGPQVTACAIVGSVALAGFGAYECYLHCGSIFNQDSAQPNAEPSHANNSAPSRKPQAPPANNGDSKPHGSPEHDAAVDKEVEIMKGRNYGDIRKNQAQVDAIGNKVGNNRPDVQGTNPNTGQREHVEIDRDPSRGQQHQQDILRNDPSSSCTLIPCPK